MMRIPLCLRTGDSGAVSKGMVLHQEGHGRLSTTLVFPFTVESGATHLFLQI